MKDMILQFIQFLKFSRILSLSFIINAHLLIMEFSASQCCPYLLTKCSCHASKF